LLEQWRQKRGLIFWAVFPSTMMLLFGLVYAHNASMRAGLDAVAAGILVGAAKGAVQTGYWWLAVFPCFTLVVISLSINFIGDALRDATDTQLDRGL
jgi:ABC-type microcin C transport system permease subunit YejE